MTRMCTNCKVCFNTHVEVRENILIIKGRTYSVFTDTRVCSYCNNPVFDRELDDVTIKAVYELDRQYEESTNKAEVPKV